MFFDNHTAYSGSTLALGAVFFAFQIYGDFSGYSDIALGTARLFGIDLLKNFAFPYFSRDIAEFWRRWHISLSTWFRDYLYIPLGGSKGSIWIKIRNTFIIFLVSGFWHGANWTFIIWGFLNALYIMPSILFNTNRTNLDSVAQGKRFPSLKEIVQMGVTFGLTVLAWIFFRAENVTHALDYIAQIASSSFFTKPSLLMKHTLLTKSLFLILFLFFLIEWIGRQQQYAIAVLTNTWPKPIRYSFYYLIILGILWFSGKEQQFIYFQF
jgi:D-alanyl-lipoteichoic acid acyltransferase DltB (MBOAT superfamily)